MQDKTQRILEEMLQLPPDMTGLRALLEGEKPTSEQLAMTANQFMEIADCLQSAIMLYYQSDWSSTAVF